MVNIGIIGLGYWGPNLLRNFFEIDRVKVTSVCDLNKNRLSKIKSLYPGIQITVNSREITSDPEIDAVIIATPVSTHYELVMNSLIENKHVLVEKPLASDSVQANRMVEEASNRNLVLMVDHTYIYTGAINKIKEILDDESLGIAYYYDSVRISLGLFQHDVNVIWDLAVHDLYILDYLFSARPKWISAVGINHIPNQPEDIAYLTLFYDNSFLAHIHVNWLAPVKVRKTLIGGDKKMIVYDDIEPSEKVKVYNNGINIENDNETIYKWLINYRIGDMYSPQIERTEALKTETTHFINCITHGDKALTDGNTGLRVVNILEAASKSLSLKGKLIEINQ